ncbi:MFS transporter [Haladaptatus halobius]|jgi:MFS family permease|uniref:MFS transporter n=1 Tax=Haladaptatus halobius TaxID=2884875 RepID=UPI001D0A7382|nr:MFS transporter [Haladaptatus halobius]
MFGIDRRVLALALARMADAVGNSFLIVVLPVYIASGAVSGDTFGLAEAMVTGIVLSLFGFLNSFTQPFAGRISDRTGKRKVFILLGLAILAVTNVAYAFAESYVSLVVIRALQGVGVAFTIPCTIALVNELATTNTRGGNMGVFNTFRLLGFGLGPIAAGSVVDGGPYDIVGVQLTGFDAAFYFAAVGAFVSYLLVTLLVSDPERTEASAGENFDLAVRGRRGGLDSVFTLGLATLFLAISIALLATIEPMINERLHQGKTWFGLQFAAFVLAQVVLQTPIGRASDRWGRRPFIVAGLVILVPSTLVQGFVNTSVQMLVARLVQGVSGALVFAPALALAGDLAREGQSGTQLSILTMSFGLGTAIGPLASGFLVQFGFAVPFELGAVLAALAALLVYTQVEETVSPGADVRPAPQD